MKRIAAALHTPKPRHLPLGKLVYRDFKLLKHLIIAQFTYHIFREIFIFQPIINQVVGRNTAINQPPYLISHSCLKACLQPRSDALATAFTVDFHSYHHCILHRVWRSTHLEVGVFMIVFTDFNRPDGTLAAIHIGGVMKRLIATQNLRKLIKRLALKRCTQCPVLRHGRQLYAFKHTFHVKPRASTQYHTLATAANVMAYCLIVSKILKEVIFISGIADVDKMISHPVIFLKILTRAKIHSTVNLAAVGADYLCIDGLGKSHCLRGLSRGSRSGYHI